VEKITRFNNRVRQVVLLAIILLLAFLIIKELYIFVPGFLGAVTLYILTHGYYQKLVRKKKWSKAWTAALFILVALIGIMVPMYFTVKVMMPRVSEIFTHSEELMKGLNELSNQIYQYTGTQLMTRENMESLQKMVANFIPTFLNSTLNILGNLAMCFFVIYFMYTHGDEMEAAIRKFIPLHDDSVNKLADETVNMVRANAIGIPLISLIQGITAAIGYWIFGLTDWGLWGFLTGIFAFFPVIGTMVIWTPLVIFLYAQGADWQATGLLIFSLLVTGNVDYLARITLMRKIGDVHPLITILGIIVGLALFGFMGFIFGPLLLSYLILLTKIYTSEFVENSSHPTNELHEPGEGH
jgi:predicted PurR-regulated permease PerM